MTGGIFIPILRKRESEMKFEEALKAMKAGSKAKLPSWGGYWYWSPEKETIIMHTKDGQELDIRETRALYIRFRIFFLMSGSLQMK